MKTFFYWLTTYYPRTLPTNEAQWDKMRETLITYYGVPNDLQVLATILGFITSRPAATIRTSYGYFANVGKRTLINKAIKEEQRKTFEAYKAVLETVAKQTAEVMKNETGSEGEDTPTDSTTPALTTAIAAGNA